VCKPVSYCSNLCSSNVRNARVGSGIRPSFLRISLLSSVTIFPSLTKERLGNPASFWSCGESRLWAMGTRLGIREVMATTMMSGFSWLKTSDETTRAGRILVVVRSVKGKATRTTSPRLKTVIDGVLGVVPEAERPFSGSQASDIFFRKTDQRRQVPKKLPLFFRLQGSNSSFNHFQGHEINIPHLGKQINAGIAQRSPDGWRPGVVNAALGGTCVSP
jgi:hypothetical protein